MGEDKMICSQFRNLDEEEEEALSFCDIPIYSDASADWGVSSDKVNAKSSLLASSSEEDGFFEFFRSGFLDSRLQPENFIFCGRLIPYGDSPSQKKANKKGSRFLSMKTCRWYKIMFGSMRLSGEMELADIKSRQRRRQKPKVMFGMYEDDGRRKLERRSSTNGFMGLVRSLSCRGHCSTSILETSIQQ